MDALALLYLLLLVLAFAFGWLLGEKLTRRHLRRSGEADYMTGYQDGRSDRRVEVVRNQLKARGGQFNNQEEATDFLLP